MLRFRIYGAADRTVVLLHGGPGAPGHMAPIARELAGNFRVIEPFQRGSGSEPLTVARHIEDLHELLHRYCHDSRPALVGSSWGAMLGLAYGAAHPGACGPLVLIGCGTFDPVAREVFHARLADRTPPALQEQLKRIDRTVSDENERLRASATVLFPLYSYEPVSTDTETIEYDARANRETWADMLRLQMEEVYPAALERIRTPVLMLHGAADPHPGALIRASLIPHLPHLEYVEWEKCGHFPWLELHVHDAFFRTLRTWLCEHMNSRRPSSPPQPS